MTTVTDPQITVAVITAGGVVLAALIGMIAAIISSRNERRRLRHRVEAVAADAKAVRHQTQNNHESNLREDVDMVLRSVARIEDNQFETRRDVARLHQDLRSLRDHVTSSDGDNERVHQTLFERLASLTQKDKP